MGAPDKIFLVRSGSAGEFYELTDRGGESMTRLIEARRVHLANLASDWKPRGQVDIEAYLKEAARSIVPDVRRAS